MIKEITFRGLNLDVEINDNYDHGTNMTSPCGELDVKIFYKKKEVKWLDKYINDIIDIFYENF